MVAESSLVTSGSIKKIQRAGPMESIVWRGQGYFTCFRIRQKRRCLKKGLVGGVGVVILEKVIVKIFSLFDFQLNTKEASWSAVLKLEEHQREQQKALEAEESRPSCGKVPCAWLLAVWAVHSLPNGLLSSLQEILLAQKPGTFC